MKTIRVLHVDDDPGFVDLTASFLERENDRIAVETATTANDGLDKLAETTVDCIVSDYEMPGRNGIELLQTIRETHADLPFILFTGKGSEEVAADAISAGATDYLQKQSGTDQYSVLANRIANCADKYRAERETELRSQAMETLNEGIAIADRDGRLVEVNEAYAESYGTAPAEMIGEHWRIAVPAAEADRLETEVLPRLAEQGEWTGETIGQRVDGSTYPKLISMARLENGGHVCTARDITDQKEREESLRQLKEEFEAVFDNAQDGIFLYDVVKTDSGPEFTLRRLNPAHESISGLSSAELRGATPREIVGEEQGAEVAANLRRCVDAEGPIEYEEVLEMPAGAIYWRTKLAPVMKEGQVAQVVGVARDITEQKEREQELERTRDFFRKAERLGDLGAWEFNESGDGVWTEGTRRIHEVDDEFVPSVEEGIKFFHPDDKETIQRVVEEAVDRGEPYDVEARLITADGNERWVRTHGEPVDDTEGETTVRGYIQDITERKNREHKLQEQTQQFQGVLDNVEVAIWIRDLDHRFELVNQNFREIFGIDETAAINGQQPSDILPADLARQFEENDRRVIDSGERVEFEEEVETTDGPKIYQTRIAPLYNGSEMFATCGVATDITEIRRDQRELEQINEQLEGVVFIVSHDLRNPLSIASNGVELVRETGDLERLEVVERAHDRMEALIQDVLSLAKNGRRLGATESVELSELVESSWEIIESADATLEVETDTTVQADESRLQQLVENLLQNAIQHGNESVTVTIGELPDGFYVEDDGPGIPPDEREAVFELGHSASPDGTGFGLGIVKQIAEAHGWTVTAAESSTGGARFEISGVDIAYPPAHSQVSVE